jgi:hypothetical protein
MKRLVLLGSVVLVLAFFSGTCLADQKNTGCGLGSVLFEGKDGLMSQTFAVTTNGTFGNQTFGMTSGTSNCDKPKNFTLNEKLNTFVAENMDGIAKDIAAGSGEHLYTLATLMEVPACERDSFYFKLQSNFSHIYTSNKVSHIEVLKNIEAVM